jgi:hypothetical protein
VTGLVLIFFSPRALAQPVSAPVDMALSENLAAAKKEVRKRMGSPNTLAIEADDQSKVYRKAQAVLQFLQGTTQNSFSDFTFMPEFPSEP